MNWVEHWTKTHGRPPSRLDIVVVFAMYLALAWIGLYLFVHLIRWMWEH